MRVTNTLISSSRLALRTTHPSHHVSPPSYCLSSAPPAPLSRSISSSTTSSLHPSHYYHSTSSALSRTFATRAKGPTAYSSAPTATPNLHSTQKLTPATTLPNDPVLSPSSSSSPPTSSTSSLPSSSSSPSTLSSHTSSADTFDPLAPHPSPDYPYDHPLQDDDSIIKNRVNRLARTWHSVLQVLVLGLAIASLTRIVLAMELDKPKSPGENK